MTGNSQLQWNMQHWFMLLDEYAKHNKELHILLHVKRNSICNKKDFFCNDVKNNKIWKEIADEVRTKCSLNCNAVDCCNEIEKLRHQYETYKSRAVTTSKVALFLTHAKHAFEIKENSEEDYDKEKQAVKEENIYPPSEVCSVSVSSTTTTLPAPIINSTATFTTDSNGSSSKGAAITVPAFKVSRIKPLQKSEWPRCKYIKLLQVYKKYESELIYPGAKNLGVWNKIAAEVRGDSLEFHCAGLECCKKINSMLVEYEKIENKNMSRKKAYAFDRAKMILKAAENEVNFSVQKPSTKKLKECGKKNKDYRLKLLQMYAKYKAEFLRPDIERKKVFEKIAKAMRNFFSYDCGAFLCRFDLLKLQREYFHCKNSCFLSQNVPFFFDRAQEAFGTTHNLDLRHIKVGNCSDESTESNKRKQQQEQNSSTSYKKMATERRSWYLGGEFGCIS